MSRKLRNCLLVHAVVQERCHKEMPESVQMEFLWKAYAIINSPKVLCEGIRMNEFSVIVAKHIIVKFFTALLSLTFLF